MDALIQNLSFDPAELKGLSEKLLRSHHQNNYSGAVKRLNAIRGRLQEMPFPTAAGFDLNGLKREELIATNSMLLHELYFDSLGATGESMTPAMALALQSSFGSVERWREEFVAMGKALAGGSGWVLLVFQPRDGSLVNQWAADHTHAVAGGIPILALDMYEHAYHLDFGAAAGQYVDLFMENVNWTRVYERYQAAVESTSEPLAGTAEDLAGAHVVDVRRAGVFEQANALIPGAEWRDPGQLRDWCAQLPRDKPVVVYCVYGHEVGRSTAMRLRSAGVDVKFLRGGIDGWTAEGRPLAVKQV
ncbi:MAG TPA: Fe-Mn family superoxide dismutase [Hydrogenophaga sp.]|nr:Fe-Mn family superoxide dismutase [Hydrogenophaga sp.]